MPLEKLSKARIIGENACTEFKCGGGKIEDDTYETVCSFSNRFGGDICLGVLNDGTVVGVPEKAAPDLAKNFIAMAGNPDVFSPVAYIEPQILKYEGKTIIHIRVSLSPNVHTFKIAVYDRVGDADVRVKGTNQIAEMYIRKHDIFTERRVCKYVTEEGLRIDLLPSLRLMAVNRIANHPWKNLSDIELLHSCAR
jgi:ATP-dependent DNA helicase RecG